jgi:hypothetical protein
LLEAWFLGFNCSHTLLRFILTYMEKKGFMWPVHHV